jgi:RsiW-degrading membrane proteinase PrsW (M82 family)
MSGSLVLVALIIVSSLPVFAVYIWFRLAKYQLNTIQFLFALFLGAAALFPALIFQDFLNITFSSGGRGQLFYQYFIRIALTEELSRLLMLFIFFWISSLVKSENNLSQSFTHNLVKKGTAIGLITGLGFSILENARYAAGQMELSIVLLRLFTAAIHAACGSRVGAAAVIFRHNPIQALFRIITATAIHGIYNFMVTLPGLPSIAAILIAISALITAIMAIRGWTKDEIAANGQSNA